MRTRSLLSTAAAASALLLFGGDAHATECVNPAEQASLELVSVEVDGVAQGDRSAYAGYDFALMATSDRSVMFMVTPKDSTAESMPWATFQNGAPLENQHGCPQGVPAAASSCGTGYGQPTQCAYPSFHATCTVRCVEGTWRRNGC